MREVIAEELRAVLARRRLSASELARRMGVSQPYISRRLTGDTALDIDDLEQIAGILGMEIADLFPMPGRVITTYATGRANDRQVTREYPGVADRTRPNGHPKRTLPDLATRRPARTAAALTPA